MVNDQSKADGKNEVEQDPKNLTASLLKLCNLTRPKHLKVIQVHKMTGRGGTGPLTTKMMTPNTSLGNHSPFMFSTGSTFYPNQNPGSQGALAQFMNSNTLLTPKSITAAMD